ncbi:MAG: laminin G domain-containing protein, partial [Candidatus Latescibacterota bacterium]
YDGLLDEIAIYDRSLSDAEILSHYTNGMSGDGYCSEDSVAPTIVSTPVTDATTNELYVYDVNASGLPAPTYGLTVFPAGMTINTLSGVIEWTPTVAGSAQVTVEATNSEGTDSQSFTIAVTDPPPCPPSMTHYWMFEETSGPPYEDYYGGNDATCTNCPAAATGIIGGAQNFDGLDDEVNATDDNSWDWGKDDSFSIAYWMKTSASTSGNRVIAARDDGGSDLHWWVGCDDTGKERFQLRDINGNGVYIGNKGNALNDGVWHFVVAVRDNDSNMNRIYVDGVKRDSAYHDYTAGFGSNVPLNIGYINLSHHYRYEGIIDELATFDKALTAAEVSSFYSKGLSGDGYCSVDSIAPAITSTPVTSATEGQLYTYDVDATGYPEPAYALTVFPTGMTIGPADGFIQWTPASPGSAQVTVEASNAKGTDVQDFIVVVEPAPVCPTGLISYWKLDETSGTVYDDYYDGNDGTGSEPAPTPAAGLIGGAQDFNGTNNYITVSDDPSLDWAYDASFTIEVWAKFTNVTGWNKVMIGRDDGGGGHPHW